jgi:hypothetical protein
MVGPMRQMTIDRSQFPQNVCASAGRGSSKGLPEEIVPHTTLRVAVCRRIRAIASPFDR